jgi:hypothetical protein
LLPTVENSHGAVQGSGWGPLFHCVISWITDFRASVWLLYSRSTYILKD